jgi:hypothetical protein
MDWIVAQLHKQLLFLRYSFYYFFFPSKISRIRGIGRNAALTHFKSGIILSFLITGIFVPFPDSDALKLLMMFAWIVFNYLIVVASSYVTEYFIQTAGGDIRNNATLIAYSYNAGSTIPLLVGANCVYLAFIDTSISRFPNVTFLEKFVILSLGYTPSRTLLYGFPSTTYIGFEIVNSLISVASVTTLIILLGKLTHVSIARSGICVLSANYAITIFGVFLFGHTLGR